MVVAAVEGCWCAAGCCRGGGKRAVQQLRFWGENRSLLLLVSVGGCAGGDRPTQLAVAIGDGSLHGRKGRQGWQSWRQQAWSRWCWLLLIARRNAAIAAAACEGYEGDCRCCLRRLLVREERRRLPLLLEMAAGARREGGAREERGRRRERRGRREEGEDGLL